MATPQTHWRIAVPHSLLAVDADPGVVDAQTGTTPLTLWNLDGAWRLHLPVADSRTAVWVHKALGLVDPATRPWHVEAGDALAALAADVATPRGLVVDAAPVYPVTTRYGTIQGQRTEAAGLVRAAHMLAEAVAWYPSALWAATGIQRIALVGALAFAGQRRQAVPDWEHHTLHWVVVARAPDVHHLRHTFHHEICHFLDAAHGPEGLYANAAWAALNAPGVAYDPSGGAGRQHVPVVIAGDHVEDDVADADGLPAGVVSSYSLAGIEEDRAELFAMLVCAPERVAALCARDPVLARKRDALMAFADTLNGGAAIAWTATAPLPESLVPPPAIAQSLLVLGGTDDGVERW